VVNKLEKTVIPSSDETSGSTFRGLEHKGAEGGREEGGREEGRDICKFRFLETENRGDRGFDSGSDIIAFIAMSQTTHIPTEEKKLN
jgi:hypothetical protein